MVLLADVFCSSLRGSLIREGAADDLFNDIVVLNDGKKMPQIDSIIKKVSTFKKADRIVWFLRLWKIDFLRNLARQDKKWTDLLNANVLNYRKKAKLADENVYADSHDISENQQTFTTFEHFFSLPLPDIQNLQLRYQSPGELITTFKKIEDAWKSNNSDLVDEDEDTTVILTFPNYVWLNLNRASCDVEADAMGHCGNSPRSDSDDQLLSLRQIMRHGTKIYYRPCLTFILNSNSQLGEMKGRGNEKPNSKYHSMIIALLKLPMIQGIKGGGYLPQNNFSLSDLPPETKKALLKEKPQLAGLEWLYNQYGMADPRTLAALHARADELDIRIGNYVPEKKEFEVDSWSNLERFLMEIDDTNALDLLEIAKSAVDLEIESSQITDLMILEMIEAIPEDEQGKLLADLAVHRVSSNGAGYKASLRKAVDAFRLDSGLMNDMVRAMTKNIEAGVKAASMARDRLKKYIECGWWFRSNSVWLNVDAENFDAPVNMTISERDFINVLDGDGDDEDDYEANNIRHNGWVQIEEDYLDSRRVEEGLYKPDKKGYGHHDPVLKKLKNITVDSETDFKASAVARYFIDIMGTIASTEQPSLDF